MNKTEFINAVAAEAALAKAETKRAVDAFVETVKDAVKNGDKVTLLGFGTFSTVEKAARRGVNPKTKEPIIIPAHKTVKFKPGTVFAGSLK
ncbi:MAG: HU family DNA-binding protein [Tannerella sp.]|nr:HU family DNA-binding protein [Tannerella sp.]